MRSAALTYAADGVEIDLLGVDEAPSPLLLLAPPLSKFTRWLTGAHAEERISSEWQVDFTIWGGSLNPLLLSSICTFLGPFLVGVVSVMGFWSMLGVFGAPGEAEILGEATGVCILTSLIAPISGECMLGPADAFNVVDVCSTAEGVENTLWVGL